MENPEQKKLTKSFIIPFILLISMWVIKLVEIGFGISFSDYGIEPQVLKGLRGIILSPFLHSDLKHLSVNSVPFFALAAGLYYFYPKKATEILILSTLITGFWVWIFAKDTGIHIGASGVIYALAAFHFVSGMIRREARLMAFSLLVVFLYGGLIWGVFPDFFPERNISWQSHLLGLVVGLILAFAYRKEGWQRQKYSWDYEDEEDDEEGEFEENIPETEKNEELGESKPVENNNKTSNYIDEYFNKDNINIS